MVRFVSPLFTNLKFMLVTLILKMGRKKNYIAVPIQKQLRACHLRMQHIARPYRSLNLEKKYNFS